MHAFILRVPDCEDSIRGQKNKLTHPQAVLRCIGILTDSGGHHSAHHHKSHSSTSRLRYAPGQIPMATSSFWHAPVRLADHFLPIRLAQNPRAQAADQVHRILARVSLRGLDDLQRQVSAGREKNK